MNSTLKKGVTSGLAVLAAALGVVPLTATPAGAVPKKCDDQRVVTDRPFYKADYEVTFRICVAPGEEQTRVSVEGFRCGLARNVFEEEAECETVGGHVRTTKNGVSSFSPLSPRLVYVAGWIDLDENRSWETNVPGCESGDFYKVFLEDFKVKINREDFTFRGTPTFSGIRC